MEIGDPFDGMGQAALLRLFGRLYRRSGYLTFGPQLKERFPGIFNSRMRVHAEMRRRERAEVERRSSESSPCA